MTTTKPESFCASTVRVVCATDPSGVVDGMHERQRSAHVIAGAGLSIEMQSASKRRASAESPRLLWLRRHGGAVRPLPKAHQPDPDRGAAAVAAGRPQGSLGLTSRAVRRRRFTFPRTPMVVIRRCSRLVSLTLDSCRAFTGAGMFGQLADFAVQPQFRLLNERVSSC